jgi:hypothetical protein
MLPKIVSHGKYPGWVVVQKSHGCIALETDQPPKVVPTMVMVCN